MTRPSLLDLEYDDLVERLAGLGAPGYRAQQIWHAAFVDLAPSYREMPTLPLDLRVRLEEELPLTPCEPEQALASADGATTKTVLRLWDGERVEVVSMEYPDRATACVSSQVGCAIGCPFCATGQSGFVRDLSSGEIAAQVLYAARTLAARGRRLSNVVYMGMGEPLLNLDLVLRSVRLLNDPRGFAMGARSFTLSTAGVVPGIDRLADEPLQVNLAVSLHAGEDPLRSSLVPLNQKYPLDALLAACRRYISKTHRRVTFEVALVAGLNDRPHHAREVAARLAGLLCHVNLIPVNPVPERRSWRPSPAIAVAAYADVLEAAGIVTTVREGRGVDIAAGCGQLRAKTASTLTRAAGSGSSRAPARPTAR